MKPNALTVVLNPNARRPRLAAPPVRKLEALLGPKAHIHVTRNLSELERLMGARRRENETVCFYGGDGSISCGLTLMIRARGENGHLPPILAVRAGTINMLCSVLGFRQRPTQTLKRWLRGELDTTRLIPTLKIEVEGRKPLYGFVFAWGLGYRVLREYYGRKHGDQAPDVRDGLIVMARTFLSACGPKASETPLFRAQDVKLKLDGEVTGLGPVYSLVAGTIDRLSLGIRPFAPAPIMPGSFHVSANGMPTSRVALHAPTLLYRLGDQRRLAAQVPVRLLAAAGTRELRAELTEGFTLDGEMVEIKGSARLRISPGPVVQFWTAHKRR